MFQPLCGMIMALWLTLGAITAVAAAGGVVEEDVPAPAAEEVIRLRILSYNVNDLPELFGGSSSPRLDHIGHDLARRRAEGTAPDVVMLQEAFTQRSERLVKLSGYPYVVRGPGRRATTTARELSRRVHVTHIKVPRRDMGGFLTNSGLYILSNFPVVEHHVEMFGESACTGFDCLANKAALHVRVAIPGLDEPLDLLTAHMQANIRRESKASRRLDAHWRQTVIIRDFLKRVLQGSRREAILAGDFNLRAPIERYDLFVQEIGARNLGLLCARDFEGCEVGEGTQRPELWRYTNDYHFLIPGDNLDIRPVFMTRNYDELLDGEPLSDHLGFEAVYEIRRKREGNGGP